MNSIDSGKKSLLYILKEHKEKCNGDCGISTYDIRSVIKLELFTEAELSCFL